MNTLENIITEIVQHWHENSQIARIRKEIRNKHNFSSEAVQISRKVKH